MSVVDAGLVELVDLVFLSRDLLAADDHGKRDVAVLAALELNQQLRRALVRVLGSNSGRPELVDQLEALLEPDGLR